MTNPIEWLVWIYGKWFVGHPWRGFFTVLVVSCTVTCLLVGVLWLKALDDYAEKQSPKPQTVTTNSAPESVTVPSATDRGAHKIDLHIRPGSEEPNKESKNRMAADASRLVNEYVKAHDGQIPGNNWLNEKLAAAGYNVWANLDCQAHGTAIVMRGSPNVHFGPVKIDQSSCDTGIDMDVKPGNRIVFDNTTVNITNGSSLEINSVMFGKKQFEK